MDKPIGALWSKVSAKGADFMAGNVEINGEKTEIVIFKNDKGDNEKRPDWKIYESKPRETADDKAKRAYEEEISVDEIPF